MKSLLYRIWQCTGGILQSLAGAVLLLLHRKDRHYSYHGAVVTEWDRRSSVSLGMFVFVTKDPFIFENLKNDYPMEELFSRLLVHEYGHTVQSLFLGPLYLLVIGIPSAVWGNLPYFYRKRRDRQISYFSFFPEKWANHLGEKVTKQKSMENLLID